MILHFKNMYFNKEQKIFNVFINTMKKEYGWLDEDFLKISKKKSMNVQIILYLCFLCCKGFDGNVSLSFG